RAIEDIEDLGPEFEIRSLRESESLIQNHIELSEVWSAQEVPRHVAELSRRRCRKGRGIQKQTIIRQIWIHTGNQIGPSHISRRAAPWRVHYCDETGGQR